MKTLFVGQSIINLESVDSTNSYAAELLRKNKPPEGMIINTFVQTNGRGQRGNTWVSEPNKNVSLSLILYPNFLNPENQFLLSKITSLAVYDLMTEFVGLSEKNNPIHIKWPNDIYFENKKIAGILIENALSDGGIKSSIIGIGININQTTFHTLLNATSLALIKNKSFNLTTIIEKLCEYIEARYFQLKANKREMIDMEYLKGLYRLNEWNKYSSNNEIFEGKITGISEQGKIIIETKTKQQKEFSFKEIQFL